MNKTLRIATWNANGLFNKHIPDLEIFLNDKKNRYMSHLRNSFY